MKTIEQREDGTVVAELTEKDQAALKAAQEAEQAAEKRAEQERIDREMSRLAGVTNAFMHVCRKRLEEKARAGCRGWDDPEFVPNIKDDLERQFETDLAAGKFEDIANRAMFLWYAAKRAPKKDNA